MIAMQINNPDFNYLKIGALYSINHCVFFSHPDFTVGFGITPNQSSMTYIASWSRGLYRRSGISPCPEEFTFYLICIIIIHRKLLNVNYHFQWVCPQQKSSLLFTLISILTLKISTKEFSYSFMDSCILFLAASTPMTLTSTMSPTLTTSRGCFTNFLSDIWEICTSPS